MPACWRRCWRCCRGSGRTHERARGDSDANDGRPHFFVPLQTTKNCVCLWIAHFLRCPRSPLRPSTDLQSSHRSSGCAGPAAGDRPQPMDPTHREPFETRIGVQPSMILTDSIAFDVPVQETPLETVCATLRLIRARRQRTSKRGWVGNERSNEPRIRACGGTSATSTNAQVRSTSLPDV